MKPLSILLCAGILVGCATPWTHLVKGDLEFEHDYAFCQAEGGMAAHGMMSDKYWLMFADVARALTARRALERCMERRGWIKGSPEQSPHAPPLHDRPAGSSMGPS